MEGAGAVIPIVVVVVVVVVAVVVVVFPFQKFKFFSQRDEPLVGCGHDEDPILTQRLSE